MYRLKMDEDYYGGPVITFVQKFEDTTISHRIIGIYNEDNGTMEAVYTSILRKGPDAIEGRTLGGMKCTFKRM